MKRFKPLLLLAVISLIITLLVLAHPRYAAWRLLWRARAAEKAGDTSQAAVLYAEAAEDSPEQVKLWALAGENALQSSQYQEAVAYLEKAAAKEPAAKILVSLGEAYWQAGNQAEAIAAWEEAGTYPDAPAQVYERLLQVHLEAGDYESAITDLQVLSARQPQDASLHYRLGLVLAAFHPEEAVAQLEKAASLDHSLSPAVSPLVERIRAARRADNIAFSLVESGRGLASLSEWDLACKAFEQAARLRPDYTEAWAFLGEAQQHVDSPEADAGLDALEHALQLDPNSLSALIFLSMYWERQGQPDQAIEVLRQAVQLDPENPSLRVELGKMLAVEGDFAAALVSYQKAVELAPRQPEYWQFLAGFSLRYDYELRETGLPAARQAVLLDPSGADSLDVMGQVLLQLGDLLDARRFLQRAIQADASHAPAHLHLGLIYLLSNEMQLARQELEMARSLAPGTGISDQVDRLFETYFP